VKVVLCLFGLWILASPALAVDPSGTPGFWLNHSDPSSKKYAKTWNLIPGGPDGSFFGTGLSWVEVLSSPTEGDAYIILARQYIAASLNELSGALESKTVAGLTNVSEIDACLDHAWALLDTNQVGSTLLTSSSGDGSQFDQLAGVVREDFVLTAEILDEFNNLMSRLRDQAEAAEEEAEDD
jgi:hypothetical protein